MGEAKRKRDAEQDWPRRFYVLVFKDGHRLAGKVVRVQRQAAFFFSKDEAELVQANNDLEAVTDVADVSVKMVRLMLKPETKRVATPKVKPKREVEETPAMKAAKEQHLREKEFAKFLADGSFVKTPDAIDRFEREAPGFGDKAYWKFLGMLFCGCTNHADKIDTWRRLLTSTRPGRAPNLMSDNERKMYRDMPATIMGWRAHKPGDADWITYAINEEQKLETAKAAHSLGVECISDYRLKRDDIIAVFFRRGWLEVVMLDPAKAEKLGEVPLLPAPIEDAPVNADPV